MSAQSDGAAARPAWMARACSSLLAALIQLCCQNDNFVKFMEKKIAFFLTTNISSGISSLIVWDSLTAFLLGQRISYTAPVKENPIRSDQTLPTKSIRTINNMHRLSLQIFTKHGWNSRLNETCSPLIQLNTQYF